MRKRKQWKEKSRRKVNIYGTQVYRRKKRGGGEKGEIPAQGPPFLTHSTSGVTAIKWAQEGAEE